MFDKEKNTTSLLKTISMTSKEAKRAAKDQGRWKLLVRALCFKGNDEE